MVACICPERIVDGVSIPYNQFFGTVFGECLYTPIDYIPWALGMISLVCWIFALMPQIISNYRRKETEALSPVFVTVWLAGDVFTFVGSVLAQQRTTLQICAAYFCINDALMLSQQFYYRRVNRASRKQASNWPGVEMPAVVLAVGAGLLLAPFGAGTGAGAVGRELLADVAPLCNANTWDPSLLLQWVGAAIAWSAGALYFFSRMPQIWHMHRSRSVDGLQISMFMLAICANTTGGMQFWIELALDSSPVDWANFCMNTLPFIIGSMGTLVFDFVIIYMYFKFALRAKTGAGN